MHQVIFTIACQRPHAQSTRRGITNHCLVKASIQPLPRLPVKRTYALFDYRRRCVIHLMPVAEIEAAFGHRRKLLRAFCPQACYAGGPGKFRYLLYKDVNRHAKLGGADIGGRAR